MANHSFCAKIVAGAGLDIQSNICIIWSSTFVVEDHVVHNTQRTLKCAKQNRL